MSSNKAKEEEDSHIAELDKDVKDALSLALEKNLIKEDSAL
jgi:hypothetical protein